MLRGWEWGDRYQLAGLLGALLLWGLLLALGLTHWLLPVLGIAVTVVGYAWRQRPWLG
jgi:hypothetical protein